MRDEFSFSNSAYSADGYPVVVVTVAMEKRATELLAEAMESKRWSPTFSHHKDYISNTRRPSFAPGMKAAAHAVAFVDFDESIALATESAQYLSHSFAGHITVVAVGKVLQPELMLAAMRSGCSEFLTNPSSEALPELLDRLETQWMNNIQPSASHGSVLSFIGAKGGVGTTTLAVHVAMYLVQCHGKRTLLIDHHEELGHVCVYLGMDGSRCNFGEVVRNVSRLDSELLRGFVGHHPSGLQVLSSPDVAQVGSSMDADSVARTLAFLRSEYDYVIIDSAPPLDPVRIAIVDASTDLYLVATPEIGAVRDLSRYIDKLIPMENVGEKLKVVLNRSASPHAIHADQIEKAIKLPISIRLPNCYPELVRAENLGEPISPNTKSELATQFIRWVDSLVGSSASRPQSAPRDRKLISFFKQGLMPNATAARSR